MGSALSSTPAERWQALQQLEAAYNQPDGNMFFTYNGDTYRSVGINANGTMRVISQTTGQMLTLDPVDLYAATRAAAGNPLPPKPSPSSVPMIGAKGPSIMTNIMAQIGQYAGVLPIGSYAIQALFHTSLMHSPFFAEHLAKAYNFLNGNLIGTVSGSLAAAVAAYSLVQGIVGMYKNGVTLSGMLGAGMSAFGVASGINMALHIGLLNPVGWAAAAALISATIAFEGINDWYKNGPSVKSVVSSAAGTAGTAVFVNLAMGLGLTNPAGLLAAGAVVSASVMNAALNDLITNGVSVKGVAVAAAGFVGTALFTYVAMVVMFGFSSLGIAFAIAAVVALVEALWSYFHQPPPEWTARDNLVQALNPVIWVQGPLVVVAVGTVAMLMGWARNRPPPVMASLTVPAYYVNQVLAASGVPSIDLKSKTPTVLVEPGDGRVVIVSPNGTDSNGKPLVTLLTYALAKDLKFVSSPKAPPGGAYIPFFITINGHLSTKPNPDLVRALTIQDKMLMAVLNGTLLTHDALNALNIAAASNKYGVGPAN